MNTSTRTPEVRKVFDVNLQVCNVMHNLITDLPSFSPSTSSSSCSSSALDEDVLSCVFAGYALNYSQVVHIVYGSTLLAHESSPSFIDLKTALRALHFTAR